MFFKLMLFLQFLALTKNAFATNVQCIDETGNPVDWFYVYKLPKNKSHPDPLVQGGVAHLYFTSLDLANGWRLSSKSIADPHSMIGRTLSPLYMNQPIISLIYNDEIPLAIPSSVPDQVKSFFTSSYQKTKNFFVKQFGNNEGAGVMDLNGVNFECGHTKGVVCGDEDTSIWLVHSVPKFPPLPNERNSHYSYPETGMKFGQTFLCVTLNTTTLNDVATQLMYNEPQILQSSLPDSMKTRLNRLDDVMQNKTFNVDPWYHIQELKTLGGAHFTSFAKSRKFNKDLYTDLVASHLKIDLGVETWTLGPRPLDSDCQSAYKVRNIQSLKFSSVNDSFTSHHDHSKWATTIADAVRESDKWLCVGDINRAQSQKIRGGGTLCTANPTAWKYFSDLIDVVQSCN